MKSSQLLKNRFAFGGQVHCHLAFVGLSRASLDQLRLFATIDQSNHSMVFGLKAFGQFSNIRPVFSRYSTYMQ